MRYTGYRLILLLGWIRFLGLETFGFDLTPADDSLDLSKFSGFFGPTHTERIKKRYRIFSSQSAPKKQFFLVVASLVCFVDKGNMRRKAVNEVN